jgi:hypothetical protein
MGRRPAQEPERTARFESDCARCPQSRVARSVARVFPDERGLIAFGSVAPTGLRDR